MPITPWLVLPCLVVGLFFEGVVRVGVFSGVFVVFFVVFLFVYFSLGFYTLALVKKNAQK